MVPEGDGASYGLVQHVWMGVDHCGVQRWEPLSSASTVASPCIPGVRGGCPVSHQSSLSLSLSLSLCGVISHLSGGVAGGDPGQVRHHGEREGGMGQALRAPPQGQVGGLAMVICIAWIRHHTHTTEAGRQAVAAHDEV